jgi:hypothetical protein
MRIAAAKIVILVLAIGIPLVALYRLCILDRVGMRHGEINVPCCIFVKLYYLVCQRLACFLAKKGRKGRRAVIQC